MKRWVFYSVLFLLGGLSALIVHPFPKHSAISEGAASVSATPVPEAETARVVRVIDGDTIELTDGRRVRYIGIDTPEFGDERTAVACFAREATEENRRVVDGKTVRLEKDISELDRYGRILRYVFIGSPAGEFVNDHLVRQGFATVATFPPDVHYQEQFLDAQNEAREQGRGLWNKCLYPTNPD